MEIRSEISGILEEMGLSAALFLADYLSTPQPSEPMVALRQQVEAYLDQNTQGEIYEDQLAGEALGEERGGEQHHGEHHAVEHDPIEERAHAAQQQGAATAGNSLQRLDNSLLLLLPAN